MRIANFNIRANPPMRRRHVRADLRVAKDTRAKVFTWQELAKLPWYRRILKQIFPVQEGWLHFHLRRRCAVTVNAHVYDVLRARAHKLTGGNAALPQPARWCNEVVVRSHLFDEYDVAVLSAHLDNGGYNGRWRPEWNRRWRQRRWDRQWLKLCVLVAQLHDEGLDVVLCGDLNRHKLPRLHTAEQHVLVDGVMHMIVVPAGRERDLEVRDAVAIAEKLLNTDHGGLVATVRRQPVVST